MTLKIYDSIGLHHTIYMLILVYNIFSMMIKIEDYSDLFKITKPNLEIYT